VAALCAMNLDSDVGEKLDKHGPREKIRQEPQAEDSRQLQQRGGNQSNGTGKGYVLGA
jgi:hypothetical protein